MGTTGANRAVGVLGAPTDELMAPGYPDGLAGEMIPLATFLEILQAGAAG